MTLCRQEERRQRKFKMTVRYFLPFSNVQLLEGTNSSKELHLFQQPQAPTATQCILVYLFSLVFMAIEHKFWYCFPVLPPQWLQEFLACSVAQPWGDTIKTENK